jgi:hypothetical protein
VCDFAHLLCVARPLGGREAVWMEFHGGFGAVFVVCVQRVLVQRPSLALGPNLVGSFSLFLCGWTVFVETCNNITENCVKETNTIKFH